MNKLAHVHGFATELAHGLGNELAKKLAHRLANELANRFANKLTNKIKPDLEVVKKIDFCLTRLNSYKDSHR